MRLGERVLVTHMSGTPIILATGGYLKQTAHHVDLENMRV